MAELTLQQISTLVKSMAAAPRSKRVPIKLIGHMGTGKTQAIEQVAKELGYLYFPLFCATQEPGDLVGIPRLVDGRTCWGAPHWIPNKDQKLLLVLEELNRAPIDVLQAMMQCLCSYKIHTNELPDDTIIVVCVNPSNDIYHVTETDPAMNSRTVDFEVRPEAKVFIEWGYKNGINEKILGFLGVHPEKVSIPQPDGKGPNPRSWHLLSNMMTWAPEELLFESAAGLIGKEIAVTFQKFCDKEYKKPVMGKDILNNYEKVKEKLGKQRHDENFATTQDLLALIGSDEKLKKDQVTNLKNYLMEAGAEWKVKVISNLPMPLLTELSKTELVEQIAAVVNEVRKAGNK